MTTKDRGDTATAATERLHKYLASTGAGSRRECETFIEQGRVAVNGKVVTRQGVKVDPAKDKVTLDGEQVKVEDRVYYLLHKPPGFISTNSDEMGRPRVVDLVHDDAHRIYTVGRLDADSAGLILLTNDGAIANLVCHPRYRIEKTYQVVVRGEVDREQLAKVEAGVWLAEGKSSPARVRVVPRPRASRRRGAPLRRHESARRAATRAGLRRRWCRGAADWPNPAHLWRSWRRSWSRPRRAAPSWRDPSAAARARTSRCRADRSGSHRA